MNGVSQRVWSSAVCPTYVAMRCNGAELSGFRAVRVRACAAHFAPFCTRGVESSQWDTAQACLSGLSRLCLTQCGGPHAHVFRAG